MSRVEMPSLKMVCGCPDGVVIKNSHTNNHLTVWNAVVNVQVHGAYAPVDTIKVQLGNALIAHIIRCSG